MTRLLGKKCYFDTNPLIYALSGHQIYLPIMTQIFSSLHAKECIGFASELGLAELLVKPIKENDETQIKTIQALFDQKFLGLLPHNRACFELSAKIRANHGLKMPDAIHIAAAACHQMDVLITADNAIAQKISDIEVFNLNDYISITP